MKDLAGFAVLATLLAFILRRAWLKNRRQRVEGAVVAYETIKGSGVLNDGESIGAERFLNLALADCGLPPRYPSRRLELVPRQSGVTINIDKVLVLERLERDVPRPVTVEVLNVKPKALNSKGGAS